MNKSRKDKKEIKKTIATIPSVNIRSTYYEDKKTGEFLGVEHEWQDVTGEWHNL